jgi:aminoglycoside phosphotransferase (APT) family kinase protein
VIPSTSRRWQPWGNATPTRVARLAPACAVVVQRLADGTTATRTIANARLLAAAGLPAPVALGAPRGRFVAWRQSRGTPGPLLLGGLRGTALAHQMGTLARDLRRLPAARLDIDPGWRSPAELHRSAGRRLEDLAGEELRIHERTDSIRTSIERVASAAWSPAPSHGDFVPANVLVRAGRIEALLDVSRLALRHPEVDLAWWELVVRFHHPDQAPRLARSLRRGYGSVDRGMSERLRDLAVVRALQLIPSAADPGRAHAVALLAAAAGPRGTRRRVATICSSSKEERCAPSSRTGPS